MFPPKYLINKSINDPIKLFFPIFSRGLKRALPAPGDPYWLIKKMGVAAASHKTYGRGSLSNIPQKKQKAQLVVHI